MGVGGLGGGGSGPGSLAVDQRRGERCDLCEGGRWTPLPFTLVPYIIGPLFLSPRTSPPVDLLTQMCPAPARKVAMHLVRMGPCPVELLRLLLHRRRRARNLCCSFIFFSGSFTAFASWVALMPLRLDKFNYCTMWTRPPTPYFWTRWSFWRPKRLAGTKRS